MEAMVVSDEAGTVSDAAEGAAAGAAGQGPPWRLFSRDTKAFIFGAQLKACQRMLDFDHLCGKDEPSVVGLITPERGGQDKFFWGSKEILLPRYRSISAACQAHPEADVLVNFASQRSAFDTTMEAIAEPSIRTVAVIAEGVPERHARIMAAEARRTGTWIIGPATVGGLAAGAFKIGNSAGTPANIVASKLHRPGSVGFVSKSGGMSNECFNIISRTTDGVHEGIAVGGDAWPGSTLLDHLLRYEANPDIGLLVMLGELGGRDEYAVCEALLDGRLTKPLVAWVTGTCAAVLPQGVQFGHAGAKAGADEETAAAKNAALRAAGAIVPDSFDTYDDAIRRAWIAEVEAGHITPAAEVEPRHVPMDLNQAVAEGLVRQPTHLLSTVTDERGDVHTYAGIPIDEVIEQGYGIGGVIGLLWFQRTLPKYATEFIELVIQLVADHGPAVAGAMNTIVTARAGKDLLHSLVSGIVTIGPRFGGAVNGAAEHFRMGLREELAPRAFVDHMRRQNIRIQGIGHRLHSVDDPDKRVTILVEQARATFPATPVLDYALAVEQVTTQKKGNLILNVDGAIGVLLVDLLASLGFTDDEVQAYVDMGLFNAFFILARSIGFMGHYFDQRRLGQGLYRHPLDDILYDVRRARDSPGGQVVT